MQINWPLIVILFGLSLPGILIATPRMLQLLLPRQSDFLKKRMSYVVSIQIIILVFIVLIVGNIVSARTGLQALALESLLINHTGFKLQAILLPVLTYTSGGLIVFLILYYGLVAKIVDANTLQIMRNLRITLGLDGCVLYGGVVEEILVRWGLMNIIVYFAMLFFGAKTSSVMWMAIIASGMLLTIAELPTYLALGCQAKRSFVYGLLILNIWQSCIFGWLFWHFDFIAALLSHMLFYVGWFIVTENKYSPLRGR